MPESKQKAPRNRTIELSEAEAAKYRKALLFPKKALTIDDCRDKTICGDAFKTLKLLPEKCFDLVFADPPYNLNKNFGENKFLQTSSDEYEAWLDSWLQITAPLLKENASIYICGDWRSSAAIQRAGTKYFKLRNRITWEREKGRGAKENWKNCAEDIWFFTAGDEYTFSLDDVRLKRQVIAPYRENGKPKDWHDGDEGKFRLTHPSNLWTDLTVPFWSMPENTDHPTQKPEKLLAKIILASTKAGDVILDPFAGSGTTSVVAKKLGRHFVSIEKDQKYCCLTEKRLAFADESPAIQGYTDGVFWERNTHNRQGNKK